MRNRSRTAIAVSAAFMSLSWCSTTVAQGTGSPESTGPNRLAVGVQGGVESTGDTDHWFLGARAVFPFNRHVFAHLSGNWHLPSGPHFGEAMAAVRVHPLPTPLYVLLGVGLRAEADPVSGGRSLDAVWVWGAGLQVRMGRVSPYAEIQNIDAAPLLQLLGGVTFPLGPQQ